MVQSINTKALLTLASVVRRPALLVPQIAVNTISQVNYTVLKEQWGIRAIIFDKDNTITGPYETYIHPLATSGLQSAVSVFGRSNVAILSNSAGTKDDDGFIDAQRIEHALGINVIRHTEKKPGGLKEVLQHFHIDDPAQLCMVGDRLLTDIVFGNLYGMFTIHTLPLCTGKENVRDNTIAKVIRTVENKVLYGNWFGGRKLLASKIPHKFSFSSSLGNEKQQDYSSMIILPPPCTNPNTTTTTTTTTTTSNSSSKNNNNNTTNNNHNHDKQQQQQ